VSARAKEGGALAPEDASSRAARARLAVDIGGTFTDAVVESGGQLASAKVLTTPAAPERGFLAAAEHALARAGTTPGEVRLILHGTTLATNALIERNGARTALVTTEGFRDSLEIGYESRYDQYDLFLDKPEPLVPSRLRFTVRERLDARGEVLIPLDEAAVRALVPKLRALEVEAIAVVFLHSFTNPRHERHAREILEGELPEVAITLSAEACPEIREYERLITTVANAYVQPLVASYLEALGRRLADAGFSCPLRVVTSAGGMTGVDTAIRFPVRLIESGPSGGVTLAETVSAECGARTALAYDMGGTTAKITVLEDYEAVRARELEVARAARLVKGSGLTLRIPVVDMIEIGAGGGSIAGLDAVGRLRVGPGSAGAEPGPACYGRGGERPTVTDADLLLGRLDPERFAEGRLSLDVERARGAIAQSLCEPLGLGAEAAAQGIVEVVGESMANAARVHAVERGRDLARCTLIAFGGAGPLHAARLAEKTGMTRVIVPVNPGVGSAVGFLRAPLAYEAVRSRYMRLSRFDAGAARGVLDALEAEARGIVGASDDARAGSNPIVVERSVLMRYVGQGHEVEVALPAAVTEATASALRRSYTARYRALFGRALADNEIEILTWNLRAHVASSPPPKARSARHRRGRDAEPRCHGTRPLFDAERERSTDVPVYWRSELASGSRLAGPALVVEPQTTTVVPATFDARVDGYGNLILERRDGDAS